MEIHAFYTEEEGLFNSSYRGSFVNLPNCSYIVVSHYISLALAMQAAFQKRKGQTRIALDF